MNKKPWTKDEKNLLRKLYPKYLNNYLSKTDLCKVFNRTVDSIKGTACRLNITNKVETSINYEYLKQLQKEHKL